MGVPTQPHTVPLKGPYTGYSFWPWLNGPYPDKGRGQIIKIGWILKIQCEWFCLNTLYHSFSFIIVNHYDSYSNPGIYKAPISSCLIKGADETEKNYKKCLFMIFTGKDQKSSESLEAIWNRYIFSGVLKIDNWWQHLTIWGRPFHNLDAQAVNDQFPRRERVLRLSSRYLPADRRVVRG